MKLKLTLATLALSLSTALSSLAVASDDPAASIKAAKAAQAEAKKLGFEWRDMGKNIKKAEALAKEGKNKKAIKIASNIAGQLDAIKKQAELAKTAKPHF